MTPAPPPAPADRAVHAWRVLADPSYLPVFAQLVLQPNASRTGGAARSEALNDAMGSPLVETETARGGGVGVPAGICVGSVAERAAQALSKSRARKQSDPSRHPHAPAPRRRHA